MESKFERNEINSVLDSDKRTEVLAHPENHIKRCSILLKPIKVLESTVIVPTEGRAEALSISKQFNSEILNLHKIKRSSVLVSTQCPVKEFSIYYGRSFFQDMARNVYSSDQEAIETDIKNIYKNTKFSQSSSLHQQTFEKKVKNYVKFLQNFETFKKIRSNLIKAEGLKKKRRIRYDGDEAIVVSGDPSAFRKALFNAKRIKVILTRNAEAERLANSASTQSVETVEVSEPASKENSGNDEHMSRSCSRTNYHGSGQGCKCNQLDNNDMNKTVFVSQLSGTELSVDTNVTDKKLNSEILSTSESLSTKKNHENVNLFEADTPNSQPSSSNSDGDLNEDNLDSTSESLSTDEITQQSRNLFEEDKQHIRTRKLQKPPVVIIDEDEDSAVKSDCGSNSEQEILTYNSNSAEVLSEDVILKWYKEAHSPKGKSIFLDQTRKFVEWLQNAEEE